MDEKLETESLECLCDLHAMLTQVLASLVGKQPKKVSDTYLYFTAKHINQAVESYIILRKGQKFYGSTLLVRTALEATFLLEAVRQKPDLLYRVAYGEHRQDIIYLAAYAKEGGTDLTAASSAEWVKIKTAFAAVTPGYAMVDQKLSVEDTATEAGIHHEYDSFYRYYCKSTHAALRASMGRLQVLSHLDNATMAMSALRALEAMAPLGGDSPDMTQIRDRTHSIKTRAVHTEVAPPT